MVLGSDLVFHLDELYGLPNLEKVYGYSFQDVVPMEPTLLYQAVDMGQVDIIPASSTDARIDLFNLTTLSDDKAALAPYDSILLVTSGRGTDPVFMSTLEPVMGLIDTETMRSLNRKFDVDKMDAGAIAEEFLISQGLL
jgi:osmoprotectant transport system substrate-binding protein